MWNFLKNIFQNPKKISFEVFHDILALIILASTLFIIFETVPRLGEKYAVLFHYADFAFLIFFGIEYIIRVITAKKPIRYIFSFLGIIDLVSFLPSLFLFSLPAAGPLMELLRLIRLVRVLRLLRVIRIVRFLGGKQQGKDRIQQAEDLIHFVNLEIYFFALFIIVTFSASLMYLFERNIPGTAFRTIPDGMWWAITTVTTVGYGDMVPVTIGGKIVAAATMISGLALLALLFSVVGPALQKLLFGKRIDTPAK